MRKRHREDTDDGDNTDEGEERGIVGALIGGMALLYAAGPQDLTDIRLLLAAQPALRSQVESRLVEAPPAIRAAWVEISSL